MSRGRDAEYTEYVAARLSSLRRLAAVLCDDWQRADDLVQATLTYQVVVKRSHLGDLPVQELCGAHADGLWFDIQVFGAHPSIDVATLFRDHMRLLGTRPANWTTSPIG